MEESCSPRIFCDIVGRGGHERPVRVGEWGECCAARWLKFGRVQWSEPLPCSCFVHRMLSKTYVLRKTHEVTEDIFACVLFT